MQDNSMHQIQNASAGNSCSCSALPTKPAQVSLVQDLLEFICSGPLLGKLSLTPERIADSIDKLSELYCIDIAIKLTIVIKVLIGSVVAAMKADYLLLEFTSLLIICCLMQYAYNGRGDRADPSTWQEVERSLTVVLFEDWMLGFKPLPMEVVKSVDPQLETVNKNLEVYYDAWDKFIMAWIVIKIKDPNCV
ncbi:hypothetical protein EZV62_004096 [Acer yangbiense]|uniref:Uncharacterized protein n=1 Tax=Acer yangbiense TaxID=1000413 RepID=A0A5C7IJ36_9ROSI|nr:hypothetical protein EZV62_004096 [Acer yangbiense]